MKIKLKAWNTFSSVEVDVETFATCNKDTVVKAVFFSFVCFFKYLCILCMLFLLIMYLHLSFYLTIFRKKYIQELPDLILHWLSRRSLTKV